MSARPRRRRHPSRRRGGDATSGMATARARRRARPRASGIRPATCRRSRARNRAGRSAAARASSAGRVLPVDAGEIGVRERVEGVEIGRLRAPARAPLSSRWLRQKARSKAGSPNQAHSASRKTGPSGPFRMFFGLTSPWTSARLVVSVVRAIASRRAGEVGMRPGGRAQIGLDADRLEGGVMGEGGAGSPGRRRCANGSARGRARPRRRRPGRPRPAAARPSIRGTSSGGR